MNRRLPLLAAGAALLALSGCSQPTTAPAAPAGSPVSSTALASAPANGATVDVATFAAAVNRPGVVVLDVRTPAEFNSGHLQNAKNIDLESGQFDKQIAALDENAEYAVYCRSGNRSGQALKIMKQQGFTNAYHLGGGISGWTAAGWPTVR